MGEFAVTVKTIDGSAATSDGSQVILKTTDFGGNHVAIVLGSGLAHNAAIGLVVAADAALKAAGTDERPLLLTERIGIGYSPQLPDGQFVQTLFLQGSGSLSFQFGRAAAEMLRDKLQDLLDGNLSPDRVRH
jgi:hypothetical protein